MARCFLAENSPQKIILLLKSSGDPQNAYILSLALFQVGQYDEAENTLLKISASLKADGLFLLAQICERQSRFQDAITHYCACLELEPTLWVAYEKLCKLGFDPRPSYNASHSAVTQMLSQLGGAYYSLTQYKLDESLEQFMAFPESQKNSGWALCQIARCYFEKYEFVNAIEHF